MYCVLNTLPRLVQLLVPRHLSINSQEIGSCLSLLAGFRGIQLPGRGREALSLLHVKLSQTRLRELAPMKFVIQKLRTMQH